jgi:Phosphate-selective porin O and P
MIRNSTPSTHTALTVARFAAFLAAASCAGGAVAADTSNKTTEQREIEALTEQLKQVQAQLKELSEQNRLLLQREQQLEQQVAKGAPAAANASAAVASSAVPPAAGAAPAGINPVPPAAPVPANGSPAVAATEGPALFGGVKLWGYGEVYYTRPSQANDRAQADLARAVFGIGYSFNDRTEFNSEFEVEHAVASADDPGEFEVEQLYIDRQLSDAVALRAGLFLMPFGFLNEHHEPTNFYGVQRNFVETLIIPSTWREGGFNFHGDTPFGLGWNVGLTTGFDLSKWDFAPEFPLYRTALELEDSDSAPLQATHQELALANAQHLSQYLALGYYGIPGLSLGAAISTGDAVAVADGNQRVTLWEGHARWTPGKFDLAALYAHGAISNLALANAANPGSPNPIPSQFYGYYVQGAYSLWERGDYRLAPFVRWERYNMGSHYQGTPGPVLPTGAVPLSSSPGDYGNWPINRDRVWTVGANFYVTPHVVLKMDYQWFDLNSDFTRFDLGLGVAF